MAVVSTMLLSLWVVALVRVVIAMMKKMSAGDDLKVMPLLMIRGKKRN